MASECPAAAGADASEWNTPIHDGPANERLDVNLQVGRLKRHFQHNEDISCLKTYSLVKRLISVRKLKVVFWEYSNICEN